MLYARFLHDEGFTHISNSGTYLVYKTWTCPHCNYKTNAVNLPFLMDHLLKKHQITAIVQRFSVPFHQGLFVGRRISQRNRETHCPKCHLFMASTERSKEWHESKCKEIRHCSCITTPPSSMLPPAALRSRTAFSNLMK